MQEIVIPIPSVALAAVVRRKAKEAIEKHFDFYDLSNIGLRHSKYMDELIIEVNQDYGEIKGKNHRLIFISEILTHLGNMYESLSEQNEDNTNCRIAIADLQYYFYSELEALGFNINSNTFSINETNEISIKISSIVEILDKLYIGQEVIFDRIEELKTDFSELLSSMPLGRKPLYQRLMGIVAMYAAEKGADEVFKEITPLINDVIDGSSQILLQN